MSSAGDLPRRVLVSLAPPYAFAPMARALLARLGYVILDQDAFAEQSPDDLPDAYLVDDRQLAEVPDDGGIAVPVVALVGRRGVNGADSRVVGAVPRPAGLHELYRVLQEVLEDTPRSTPRVPTHLAASCFAEGVGAWRGTVVMISENGCLLRSHESLLLGSKLGMRIDLPRLGQLELEAEVAYQLPPDVGMVFSAALPQTREALLSFVEDTLAAGAA